MIRLRGSYASSGRPAIMCVFCVFEKARRDQTSGWELIGALIVFPRAAVERPAWNSARALRGSRESELAPSTFLP